MKHTRPPTEAEQALRVCDVVDVRGAAEMIGCSEAAIRAWVRDGQLDPFAMGNKLLFAVPALRAFIPPSARAPTPAQTEAGALREIVRVLREDPSAARRALLAHLGEPLRSIARSIASDPVNAERELWALLGELPLAEAPPARIDDAGVDVSGSLTMAGAAAE